MLGAFLSRALAEAHEAEGILKPRDVAHQVMLHLQFGGHRQPKAPQLAEHVPHRLVHRPLRRLADDVGRAEIVAAHHVHGDVLVNPHVLPGHLRLAAQGHVVHRDLRERVLAHLAVVLRAQCVLVVEVAVAVGIHRRRVHHVLQVVPDGGLAQFHEDGPALRIRFLRVVGFAGFRVVQFPCPADKFVVKFKHPRHKRLVVRAPEGQYQVLHLAAHLTGIVAAQFAAQQRVEAVA